MFIILSQHRMGEAGIPQVSRRQAASAHGSRRFDFVKSVKIIYLGVPNNPAGHKQHSRAAWNECKCCKYA